jgi:hypothetical protein
MKENVIGAPVFVHKGNRHCCFPRDHRRLPCLPYCCFLIPSFSPTNRDSYCLLLLILLVLVMSVIQMKRIENDGKMDKQQGEKKLREDILNGTVTAEMSTRTVYNMHDGAYHKFEYVNFRTNLRNLRLAIARAKEAAREDEVALGNVMQEWRRGDVPAYPQWHNSVAKEILLRDLDNGILDGISSRNVYHMHPEYSAYPYKVFRDHLNKEKKLPVIKAYWEHQKELYELKKERKQQRNE